MMYVNTTHGLGRIEGEELAVLQLPYADLAEALQQCGLEGLHRASIASRCPYDVEQIITPFGRARKVIIVGANHTTDPEARTQRRTEDPILVIAPGNSVTGPGCGVYFSASAGEQVIPEGEVALVIGTAGRDVSLESAWDHVAGITMMNDLTAVDLMKRAFKDHLFATALGKSFEGFKPAGPGLLPREYIESDYDIEIVTRVNGDVIMQGRTSDYIHSAREIIAFASRYVTLEPGDLISMGAPADPQRLLAVYLSPGDVIEVSAEGLGMLRTPIISPPVA